MFLMLKICNVQAVRHEGAWKRKNHLKGMHTGSDLLPENIVYHCRIGGVSDDDSVLFIDFFLCTNKIN